MFLWDDMLRRAQGNFLTVLGFGPSECPYKVKASAPLWRLRDYGGGKAEAAPILIVAAPIKQPYLWDLTPRASAVRALLGRGFRIYLLEWVPPSRGGPGARLEDYAANAIADCVAHISSEPLSKKPMLMGHSLGGTFAAIFAASRPQSLRALVLLGAPLCFARASSRFTDAVADSGPVTLGGMSVVQGSQLSEFCAFVSPEIFIWSRIQDVALSAMDPAAMNLHMRIERWALDEVALSGRLVDEVLQWLYRENRFCQGTLPIGDKLVGPKDIVSPTLAVATTADDVASAESIVPFIAALPTQDARMITYSGEIGVALQHLGILVGREAHARFWPEIFSWLEAHA